MNKTKGFSLVEMVIGVALMGLLIVSVLAVFSSGVNALKKGNFQAAVTRYTESKVAQVRLLFTKCPQFNRDVEDEIKEVITGKNISISPSGYAPVYIWKYPPEATSIIIEGEEDMAGIGFFKFEITIEDYEGPTYNYDIKKVKVKTKSDKPPLEIEMSTLMALGMRDQPVEEWTED